jgi:hypothetical protein
MAVRRCSVCGHLGIDVPDVRALDVLVRLPLRREYARASTGICGWTAADLGSDW